MAEKMTLKEYFNSLEGDTLDLSYAWFLNAEKYIQTDEDEDVYERMAYDFDSLEKDEVFRYTKAGLLSLFNIDTEASERDNDLPFDGEL